MPLIEKICETCGKKYVGIHNKRIKSKYCSRGCYHASIRTHGMSKTSQYHIWEGIKARCFNPNNSNYKRYGAVGITMNKRWASFTEFWKDMGDSHFSGAEIDRIDNDGNYCKENCRWVTAQQQTFNRGGKSNSSSRYKGVNKEGKIWRAQIFKDGTRYEIGRFPTEEIAALAYNEMAKEWFGEYAYLNKV